MPDTDTVDDLVRWSRRQDEARELSRRIPDALAWSTDDPAPLKSTAVALADLLRRVHGDEALWSQLSDGQHSAPKLDVDQKARLRAAVQLNWAGFLLQAGHRPPPPASELAEEFRREVTAAIDAPPGVEVDLDGVRRRIADFASRLDNASNDERPGWLKRLRSIVRRVQPTLPGIIVVHGTAALLGLGATVALAPVAPPVLVTAAAGLIKIAATKVLERLYPPDTATSKEPTSANEQQAVGDRLRVALDLADLARGHETLKTLATGASLDSAQAPPGRAVAEAQVRCMVDELFAATFLAIEALPVGPASQPLLEALTRLADASAPVAAALTRPVPDPAEALRWWPEYEYAFWEAARAVAHDEPPPPDTLSW